MMIVLLMSRESITTKFHTTVRQVWSTVAKAKQGGSPYLQQIGDQVCTFISLQLEENNVAVSMIVPLVYGGVNHMLLTKDVSSL